MNARGEELLARLGKATAVAADVLLAYARNHAAEWQGSEVQMVITVFRSRLRQDHADEFHVLADRMLTLAKTMRGFVSYKSFASEDGERCSIIEFDSPEHLRAWREHPQHRQAQQLGRERFYAEYSLYVAEPEHEAHFRHEPA